MTQYSFRRIVLIALALPTLGVAAPEHLAPFEAKETAKGVHVEWDSMGADFIDLFQEGNDGGWKPVLTATPAQMFLAPAGSSIRFATGNPRMWKFRTVRRDAGWGATALAIDAEGKPMICYQKADGSGITLATRRGLRWEVEDIAVGIPRTMQMVVMPNGNPLIVITEGDGVLCAERSEGGEWVLDKIAKGSAYSLAISPGGEPTVTYGGERGEGQTAVLAMAQRKDGKWISESVLALGKGIIGCATLAYSSNGEPGIAYTRTEPREGKPLGVNPLHLIEQKNGIWKDQKVADDGTYPCLAYGAGERCGIAFLAGDGGVGYLGRNGEIWALNSIDPGRCMSPPSLAFGASNRIHILYQESTDLEKPRLRYASHDGMDWHTQTLWTDTSGVGLSLQSDMAGNPVFSFLDEDGEQLRYGALMEYREDVTKDDRPIKPIAPYKELEMQGEILKPVIENLLGDWERPEPGKPTEYKVLSLDAKGGFAIGMRSPLTYLLEPGMMNLRGSFVFSGGTIKAEWKKEGNQLAVFDEEKMEIEVVSVTANQLELRFHPGRPSEVFRRGK